jgi:chaperone modulatory protein CbpM
MENGDLFDGTQLNGETIEMWMEAGWISSRSDGKVQLSEIDWARARLIHDLKHGFGVNDEGVPIVLDLVDQLHGLRRAMRELIARTRS